MNKLVTVLGVAAVATLAGCKDPHYKPMSTYSQTEPKDIEMTPDVKPAPVAAKPSCTCPAGTKHSAPCACGADDCMCVVEVKPRPAPVPAVSAPSASATPEGQYTVYVVRKGDYLAKISKKFNVTIASIRRLNGLSNDTIRVGQKLKLPGKLDVGEQPVEPSAAKSDSRKKAAKQFEPYRGATKEYVVKGGDTLGAVAYGNGCNIRQLKELNGLKSDVLKVGQKLKVPAEGKAAPDKAEVPKAVAAVPAPAKAEPAKAAAPAVEAQAEAPVKQDAVAAPAPAPAPAPAEPAADASATYVVQEGDDMTGVSIRFGVSAAAIRELNNLAEDAQLAPGQIIKLPAEAQQ